MNKEIITNPEASSGINYYRVLANGLTLARLVMTPVIAKNIRTKTPEERTVLDSVVTGLTCLTDFFDGKAADLANDNSVFGAEFDQITDKLSVGKIDNALASTGEVPGTQAKMKIARNVGVTLLRTHAKLNGRAIPVDEFGKQATGLSLANIVLSNSPMAKHNEVIKATMAHSTAASLISGANYAIGYLKSGTKKESDSARNGIFRQLASRPADGLASFLAKRFPDLTADDITNFGEKLTTISGEIAELDPDNPALATAMFTAGGLCDLLDGTYARLLAKINGDDTTSAEGMITDVEADKRQEIAILINLSNIALERGYYVASTNYALAAMTRVLPSLFRANAESEGYVCDEDGLGTRPIVAFLCGVGMALNKNEDISNLVSSMILQGNFNTAIQRRDVALRGPESPYCVGVNDDSKFKELGELRAEVLTPLAIKGAKLGSQNLLKIRKQASA